MLVDPKDPDQMWWTQEPCLPKLREKLLKKSWVVHYPVPMRNKNYRDKWTRKLITNKTHLPLQKLLEQNEDGTLRWDSLTKFMFYMMEES